MDFDARLREALSESLLNMKEVSLRAGLNPGYLSSLLRRKESPTVANMLKIARALNVSPSWLIGAPVAQAVAPVSGIPIVGSVAAGDWREAVQMPEDEWDYISVPADSGAFGLRVEGDSMDEVYPSGSILICEPLDAYGGEVVEGDHVIVERWRAGEVEATCKEIGKDLAGRIWLRPRSKNPEYAPIRLPAPNSADAYGTTIRITAIVVGSYQPRSIPKK